MNISYTLVNMKKKIVLLLSVVFLTNIAFGQDDDTTKGFYNVEDVRSLNITFEQSNWAELLDSIDESSSCAAGDRHRVRLLASGKGGGGPRLRVLAQSLDQSLRGP